LIKPRNQISSVNIVCFMTNQANQVKNLIVVVIQKKLIIGTDAKASHGISVYIIGERSTDEDSN